MDIFFIRIGEGDEREVTRAEWIVVERAAGFRPKMAFDDPKYMETCATGGFSGQGLSGRVAHSQD